DDKFRATATFAACMTVQHILKLAVFAFVGFSLVSWLPLVAAMIVSGMLGTWMGLKVLNKLSARYFDKIFKGLITVLAIRLIWQALL
ncbi:MAG: TSUP family transporter, partial [Pontibacterium sp.]